MGLKEKISFLGPKHGADKDALLNRADAFVLASHSEGLPMAVLEAWAYRKPVLMTPQCNLQEGFVAGAAIRTQPDSRSIAEGLEILFSMSDSELRRMGLRGRRLVEERFTWPQVALNMKEVYEWMLGGGSPPSCVITD